MAELRLILLRHAEAEAESLALSDHARQLTQRGRKNARTVAERIASRGWKPHYIVASDARRTLETSEIALDVWGRVAFATNGKLYLAGLDAIGEVLQPINADAHAVVMLVGHNPGFSEAASRLSAQGIALGNADAALLSIDAPSWFDAAYREMDWRFEGLA